jgi:hypothetical protein
MTNPSTTIAARNHSARQPALQTLLFGPLPEKGAALGQLALRALGGGLTGGLLYLLSADDQGVAWGALGDLALKAASPLLRALGLGGAAPPTGLGPLLSAAGIGALGVIFGPSALRVIAATHPALAAMMRRARVSGLTLRLPLAGGTELKLDTAQADALYPLYVQLSSRVSNQSLALPRPGGPEYIGDLGIAIKSLRELFEHMRAALTSNGPEQVAVLGGGSAATLVVQAIDGAIRPFLSRWHPHWDRWVETGLPEARWPAHLECRADLERALARCRAVVAALGALYGAEGPALEGEEVPAMGDELARTFGTAHPNTLRPVGWGKVIDEAWVRLHRTLVVGIGGLDSPAPLPSTPAALRTGLAEWRALLDEVEAAIAALPPIPPDALVRAGEDGVPERRPDDTFLQYLRALREPLPYLPAADEVLADAAPREQLEDVAEVLNDARERLRGALLLRPGEEDRGPLPSRRAP